MAIQISERESRGRKVRRPYGTVHVMLMGSIDARDSYNQCEYQPCLANRHCHLSFICRIALIRPVSAKAGRKIEDTYLCESHLLQFLVGRLDVGAMVPGAAATIDDHLPVVRQRCGPRFQLLHTFRSGHWSNQFCAANVALVVEDGRANVQNDWFLSRGRLDGFGQFIRLHTRQVSVGRGRGLRGSEHRSNEKSERYRTSKEPG